MSERTPEAFVGAIMAFEGVEGCLTAMNGPTGCKYYPASLAEAMTRSGGFNPMMHRSRFYMGQSRLPCTYMDGNDYVSGAKAKMDLLWQDCVSRRPSLVALINSPGASLIGEVLEDYRDVPAATMESPPPSEGFSQGYESATIAVLEALRPEGEPEPMSVNLLGISIADLGWRDSIAELRRLLGLCGVTVVATLGACTVEDIRRSAKATLNVAVHDERCARTAEWFRERYGTAYLRTPGGAPLGFSPLQEWLEAVCHELGADPSPALDEIGKARRRAHRELSRLDGQHGVPRGRSFSVEARPSLALAVLRTLHGYLGMVPVAVSLTEQGPCSEAVEAYLRDSGCGDASSDIMSCPADLALCDGNTAVGILARGMAGNAVVIDPPTLTNVSMRADPLLGLEGTLRLLDHSLQGLRR